MSAATTTARRAGAEVRPARSRRELRAFIRLPWRLYAGVEQWVPPLLAERRRHLDRRRNAFFEHAEAEYFLAWRDGRPVGRITAHVDHRLNAHQGNDWGLFGFFECEDDPAAARELVDTAAAWLRERGRDRMVGPMDFTTNHECGLLVEGHDLRPQLLENWHHPYYARLLEGCGLVKTMDLLKWQIMVAHHDRVLRSIYDIADQVGDHGIAIRHMRRRDFDAELGRFMDVYNTAWARNWGFVPLTDAELRQTAKELKPLIDEEWTWIAEAGGETVGAALTLPDYNLVLAKLGGRLLPTGWWRLLRARGRLPEIRVLALGVKPAYRHTGVGAALYREHWEASIAKRIHRAEAGWILETNRPMNRALGALAGTVVKRYRLYERPLAPPPRGGAPAAARSTERGAAPERSAARS